MSTPSLGRETPQASPPPHPPAPQAGRQQDDDVQYLYKSVQALRGRESAAKARWQNGGWELVSENRGTLRTELNFRRVKPKTLADHLLTLVAAFQRAQPTTRLVLVASCALILAAGLIGIALGTQGEGDPPGPSVAQSTASAAPAEPAEPAAPSTETTVTDITVDALVDRINAGETKLGDQFRLTGVLVGSDVWSTGASGDFIVMLDTAVGSDLEVYADESAASEWRDGMKVEMVVKNVERTIDGETIDGFFEALSARPISG